jgi:hypothetical protein
MNNSEFKFKRVTSKLARNITIILPMIEELANEKVEPICLIGFSVNEKTGKVHAHLSTVSDDKNIEAVLLIICKEFIKSQEQKQVSEKINTNQDNTITYE